MICAIAKMEQREMRQRIEKSLVQFDVPHREHFKRESPEIVPSADCSSLSFYCIILNSKAGKNKEFVTAGNKRQIAEG